MKGQPDPRQEHPNAFIFTHERSTDNYEVYSTAINAKGDQFWIWLPQEMSAKSEYNKRPPAWFNAFCSKQLAPCRHGARPLTSSRPTYQCKRRAVKRKRVARI